VREKGQTSCRNFLGDHMKTNILQYSVYSSCLQREKGRRKIEKDNVVFGFQEVGCEEKEQVLQKECFNSGKEEEGMERLFKRERQGPGPYKKRPRKEKGIPALNDVKIGLSEHCEKNLTPQTRRGRRRGTMI